MIDNLIKQKDAVEDSLKEFTSSMKEGPSLKGADMGIHDFNMMIGGHIPGKLTSIAGRSGHGKTALTIPMFKAAERVVSGKVPAFIFFTWEMAAKEVVGRYISNYTGLSWRRLYQLPWTLEKHHHASINEGYDKARGLPIMYQELSTNISSIRGYCEEFAELCVKKSQKTGIQHVPVSIVDYVGMAKFGGNELRTYGIGDFMNGAKQIAKEFGIHKIVLAQIRRSADSKEIPDRDDLSDSQSIEQASDNLIIAHRPEHMGASTINMGETKIPAKDKMILRYVKGRNTGIGDRIISCNISTNRFWDMDHEHEFEYWKMYEDMNFWKNKFS